MARTSRRSVAQPSRLSDYRFDAVVVPAGLWAVFTVIAALAQTARNALQRSLVERVGTVGATHVRFLYGLPFSLLFYAIVETATPTGPLTPGFAFWAWVTIGALTQILATALMLAAMRERSFVVATATIKTEPVLVAIFAVALLGDHLSVTAWGAILVATAGIVVMTLKPGEPPGSMRPIVQGLVAAAFFGLAATGFRGAITSLNTPDYVHAATTTLVAGLAIQTLVLSLYLAVTDRPALLAIVRAWRPSLVAGFMGALASQFWFLAFAVETAAKVRTLALIEVIFAGVVSGAIIKQATSPREGLGIVMIVAGVAILIAFG